MFAGIELIGDNAESSGAGRGVRLREAAFVPTRGVPTPTREPSKVKAPRRRALKKTRSRK